MSMQLDKTVGFRVSVFRNPQAIWQKLKPEGVKSEWIPQTVGDQVWMFFEFNSPEEKQEYVDKLESFDVEYSYAQLSAKNKINTITETVTILPKEMLMELDEEFLNHWT